MKKGDKYIINNNTYYFVGYDRMTYNNKRLIILATDIKNINTYGRYTPEFLKGGKHD